MRATGNGITAWSPWVEGITEAFHAHLTDHAYPMHAHASWTLLVIDDGVVTYDLHRHRYDGLRRTVTLLPAARAAQRCPGHTAGPVQARSVPGAGPRR